MRSVTLAVTAVLAATSVVAAATPTSTAKGVQSPSAFPILGAKRSHGCYSSSGNLVKIPQVQFPSMGSCTDACKALSNAVSGLHGSDCYCGDSYPPRNSVADDKSCNYPCPFYDLEACT